MKCHPSIVALFGLLTVLGAFASSATAIEAKALVSMLPEGSTLNPAITPPEEYLGWEVGSRHVRHHEVVGYAKHLSEQSDRLTWRPYGQTYGMRPLGILIVSRPDRQSTLVDIVRQRQAWAYGADEQSAHRVSTALSPQLPSVVWLGYSIHGDEAGAVNASLLMMYLLAAAEGPWIESILEQQIVLLDPSLNPDGIDRFAQWVNDHRGLHPSPDPNEIEHQQGWPKGRTNHYGFDLNRDWLPATQPESQGRLALFYEWLPNLLLDFHEMGSDQSLFFQPGIEGRDHPMTPALVRDITQGFAQRFASSMDAAGQRFFTREKYDDFYPGKGSTYPDLHGGIGILVEQGSTRGLVHDYAASLRRFDETVLNPLRLSIATVSGLQEYHRSLLEYQRDFYTVQRAARLASQPAGFAIEIPRDRRVAREFIAFLQRHQLQANELARPWSIEEKRLDPKEWWILPSDQRQGLFLQAIMDRTKEFPFDKFYDVSAWNMVDAFGLEWRKLDSVIPSELIGPVVAPDRLAPRRDIDLDPRATALVFPGNSVHATPLAFRLAESSIKLRMAKLDCQVTRMNEQRVNLPTGSFLVHRADQSVEWAQVVDLCHRWVDKLELEALAVKTSMTETGPDLGSDHFEVVSPPRIALLAGEGTAASSAGGLWFAIDRLLEIPCARLEPSQMTEDSLTRYDCLLIPDGEANRLQREGIDAIRLWVRRGGHVVLLGASVAWWDAIVSSETEQKKIQPILSQTDGIVLKAELISGHAWGRMLGKKSLTVFQTDAFWPIDRGAILTLDESPLLAGYLSEANQEKLAKQTVLGQSKAEKGLVTAMTFDPTFRGHYWSTIALLKQLFFPVRG